MKIDISVQSYKKPESLLYTLMTLKAVAGDMIDTVYINDDCSNDGTIELYKHPDVVEYFKPWKLDIRCNTKSVGIKQVYIPRYYTDYMDFKFRMTKWWRFHNPKNTHNSQDIRYQYALDKTDKKYLFIIHDDVKFIQNVVQLYLDAFSKNSNLAIVGDLGQCWRCKFLEVCSPKKLMTGFRPSKYWPMTPISDDLMNFNPENGYTRACRINEWSCMVDVEKSHDVTKRKRCFFGNSYRHSDTGAFWFGKAIECGYDFSDPLASDSLNIQSKESEKYYVHAWQGHSGHSVWVDQGQGISRYNKEEIIELMKQEFGFNCPQKLVGNL